MGDQGRCFYCGISLLMGENIPESHPHFKTKDHFVPKSRRKLWAMLPTSIHNMPLTVAACSACNNIKSNRTPESLREHVRKMNGNDTFLCEALMGITFRSMPDYLAYCKAAMEQGKQEKAIMTKRSLEAVKQRREAGLLPPVGHKSHRKKAMQENDWWNAMNACGKLIFTLERHGIHPEVREHLRETITLIKSALPEQFSRKAMSGYEPTEVVSVKVEIGINDSGISAVAPETSESN